MIRPRSRNALGRDSYGTPWEFDVNVYSGGQRLSIAPDADHIGSVLNYLWVKQSGWEMATHESDISNN